MTQQPIAKVVDGLRVFFKTLALDGSLHHYDLPLAEALDEDLFSKLLVISDNAGNHLMYVNPDAVSFILPAKFEVPDAQSPS